MFPMRYPLFVCSTMNERLIHISPIPAPLYLFQILQVKRMWRIGGNGFLRITALQNEPSPSPSRSRYAESAVDRVPDGAPESSCVRLTAADARHPLPRLPWRHPPSRSPPESARRDPESSRVRCGFHYHPDPPRY